MLARQPRARPHRPSAIAVPDKLLKGADDLGPGRFCAALLRLAQSDDARQCRNLTPAATLSQDSSRQPICSARRLSAASMKARYGNSMRRIASTNCATRSPSAKRSFRTGDPPPTSRRKCSARSCALKSRLCGVTGVGRMSSISSREKSSTSPTPISTCRGRSRNHMLAPSRPPKPSRSTSRS